MKLRSMTALYLVQENALLCLHREGSKIVDGLWVGAAGGHFEMEEFDDPQACVLRELKEELGLEPGEIEGLSLRYITQRLKNDEIRQNYYFFARLNTQKNLRSNEGTLAWVAFDQMENLPMPVSAAHMIAHYLRKGRFDETLYAGVTWREGTHFTPMEEF